MAVSALTVGGVGGVFFTLRSKTSFAELGGIGRWAELDAWAALAGVERLSGLGRGETIFGVTEGSLFTGGGVDTPLAAVEKSGKLEKSDIPELVNCV